MKPENECKKSYLGLAILAVLGLVGGGLYYKKMQDDKKKAEAEAEGGTHSCKTFYLMKFSCNALYSNHLLVLPLKVTRF